MIPGMGKKLLVSALGATALLWAGFNAWFFVGDNYRIVVTPVTLGPGAWQVVQGDGREVDGDVRLETPGARGNTLAAGRLDRPLEIADIERIRVRFKSSQGLMQASAGVSSSKTLSDRQVLALTWAEDDEGWVDGRDLFWTDENAYYLLVEIRGALDPPVVVDEVTIRLSRADFFKLQRMLFESLVSMQPWTQRSINQVRPDYRPLAVTPVVTVVAWVALAFVLFLALARFQVSRQSLLGVVGLLVLVGWVLLDIGWQLRLWSNHADAVQVYSGKTPGERREVEIDGDVFRFVEGLKKKIDNPDKRWVIFAPFQFDYFRARYFAVPHPVVSWQGVNSRWLWRMRPGSLAVFVHLADDIVAGALDGEELARPSGPVERPVDTLVGQDARLVEGQGDLGGLIFEMHPDKRPWLLQSGWFDLSAGLWRLKVPVGVRDREGWVRVQVFRRNREDGQSRRLAIREVFVQPGEELRDLSVAFPLGENQQVLFRVRELDARGSVSGLPQLGPIDPEGDLVELRGKNSPWSLLARKVLESEVGVAYELL